MMRVAGLRRTIANVWPPGETSQLRCGVDVTMSATEKSVFRPVTSKVAPGRTLAATSSDRASVPVR